MGSDEVEIQYLGRSYSDGAMNKLIAELRKVVESILT